MFPVGTFSIVPTALSARTDAPRRMTLARKRRAFFSAGVGMQSGYYDSKLRFASNCCAPYENRDDVSEPRDERSAPSFQQ